MYCVPIAKHILILILMYTLKPALPVHTNFRRMLYQRLPYTHTVYVQVSVSCMPHIYCRAHTTLSHSYTRTNNVRRTSHTYPVKPHTHLRDNTPHTTTHTLPYTPAHILLHTPYIQPTHTLSHIFHTLPTHSVCHTPAREHTSHTIAHSLHTTLHELLRTNNIHSRAHASHTTAHSPHTTAHTLAHIAAHLPHSPHIQRHTHFREHTSHTTAHTRSEKSHNMATLYCKKIGSELLSGDPIINIGLKGNMSDADVRWSYLDLKVRHTTFNWIKGLQITKYSC